METNPRPKSVTVVCWTLIITGLISLVTSTFGLKNPQARAFMEQTPLPMNVQIGMLYVGLFVSIVCGAVMLQGRNWGRILYVTWSAFGSLIGIFTTSAPRGSHKEPA